MPRDAFPVRAMLPELQEHVVTMVGTGASAPTKVYGPGVTITRTGAGDYRLTWSESPGAYVSASFALRATTESDIKNHSVIIGTWDSSGLTLDLTFWDASAAAHDLAASEWIELLVRFKTTAV